MLIIFAGLPGTGKTTIARELARQMDAVYLRIDSIEQALRHSGAIRGPINDTGYRVGHAIAEDNLRLARTVIADSVNPLRITRDAWVAVAIRARVRSVEVEIVCSDQEVHRNRVERRRTDIDGLKLPTWRDVVAREYDLWNRKHIVIDTAGKSAAESIEELRKELSPIS